MLRQHRERAAVMNVKAESALECQELTELQDGPWNGGF